MWFKVDGAYCEARVCTTQRLPVRLQWMDSAEGQSLADRVLLLTVAEQWEGVAELLGLGPAYELFRLFRRQITQEGIEQLGIGNLTTVLPEE